MDLYTINKTYIVLFQVSETKHIPVNVSKSNSGSTSLTHVLTQAGGGGRVTCGDSLLVYTKKLKRTFAKTNLSQPPTLSESKQLGQVDDKLEIERFLLVKTISPTQQGR